MTPKFCRIAIVVDDMASFIEDGKRLLGLDFIRPKLDDLFDGFTVMFGEHGLEPIQLKREMAFARDGRLIEVAIDVADAEMTRAELQKGGYEPIVSNHLPAPDATEYLFGREFHGLPLMVCTAGDNETQMREQGEFLALADAPLPKVGCISVFVADLDGAARDLGRFFGMHFVETDPGGLGNRALVGPHRIKLVQCTTSAMDAKTELPLAAIEYIYDDVEPVKQRMVAAGYPVKYERTLKTGGKAYYFGETFQHMPVVIYPSSADGEVVGEH